MSGMCECRFQLEPKTPRLLGGIQSARRAGRDYTSGKKNHSKIQEQSDSTDLRQGWSA